MEYKIEVKEIEDITVVSERFVGTSKDNMKYGMKLFRKYWKNKEGAIFSLYYDKEYKEVTDTEICIPVITSVENEKSEYKVIPGVRAVCTKHIGYYDTIATAYTALFHFLRENGLEMKTPTRLVFEKYPKGLLKGKDEDYITEIIIPFSED